MKDPPIKSAGYMFILGSLARNLVPNSSFPSASPSRMLWSSPGRERGKHVLNYYLDLSLESGSRILIMFFWEMSPLCFANAKPCRISCKGQTHLVWIFRGTIMWVPSEVFLIFATILIQMRSTSLKLTRHLVSGRLQRGLILFRIGLEGIYPR